MAPAGVHSADSEEIVRFQNSQLYAAHQSCKNEIHRLQAELGRVQSGQKSWQDSASCVARHWASLTQELRSTFNRLEGRPADVAKGGQDAIFDSIMSMQNIAPADMDTGLSQGCTEVRELMQEVVQALMDNNARYQQLLADLHDKAPGDKVKQELAKLTKQLAAGEKALGEARARERELEAGEAGLQDEVKKATAAAEDLREQLEAAKNGLETAERRLAKSEERYRQLAEMQSNAPAERAQSGGAGGGDTVDKSQADELRMKRDEYKQQADARLQEIKNLQKEMVSLQVARDQNAASAAGGQGELTDERVKQSTVYRVLFEKYNELRKECETTHLYNINKLETDLVHVQNQRYQERKELEKLHHGQIQVLSNQLKETLNEMEEVKNEQKKVEDALAQKDAGNSSKVRTQELEKMVKELEKEYKRIDAECRELKKRPDTEEIRRTYRESEEKVAKERDIEALKVAELTEKLKAQERSIALMKKEGGGNGVNGNVESKELEAMKKDIEALRAENKDTKRRFFKADRGFKDLNVLYSQVKKERDALMHDLESLGSSFEEMQEQNIRLLNHMKSKEEEQNEMLRQRMKEKQEHELIQREKAALKEKLTKVEDLGKSKDDLIDRTRQELEAAQAEAQRKKQDEEGIQSLVSDHMRKVSQSKSSAVQEAQRLNDRALKEKESQNSKTVQQLSDATFQNNRLQEKIHALEAKLQSALEKSNKQKTITTNNPDMDNLLDHYRSRIKCHCRLEDKTKVLPCGHALCQKCCEGLIKDRSRKCPSCAKKFDQTDIRPLYLMGSTEMDQ